MRRVFLTTEHFGVRALVCVNKADLYPAGTAEIEIFCEEHGIEMIGRIPFDAGVTEAMVHGQPVTEAMRTIWAKVLDELQDSQYE